MNINNSPRDDSWLARYLPTETVTVDAKDLYCAMLNLLCLRADLFHGNINDLACCGLCKLGSTIDCAIKQRTHINNIASKIGLCDSALVTPEATYSVHRGLDGIPHEEHPCVCTSENKGRF